MGFKPYLRIQVLLKFLFTAMCINQIDGIGYASANLWAFLCFWQCFEGERFLFVCRYKQPPNYSNEIVSMLIDWVLPLALLVHAGFSFFLFGWVWEVDLQLHWQGSNIKVDNGEDLYRKAVLERSIPEADLPKISLYRFGDATMHRNDDIWFPLSVFWILEMLFLIVWLQKRWKIWDFKEHDTFDNGTDLARSIASSYDLYKADITTEKLGLAGTHLTYSEALKARDDAMNGRSNDIARVVRINVNKYIPDPTRFEFGGGMQLLP